jgi:hypothetical protein
LISGIEWPIVGRSHSIADVLLPNGRNKLLSRVIVSHGSSVTLGSPVANGPEMTDDMTVAELLGQLTVHRFASEADALKDDLFAELDRQFDAQVQELVEMSHEKENEIARLAEEAARKPGAVSKKTSATRAPTTRAPIHVRVVVLSGPHMGEEFLLDLKAAHACIIGRSTSVKTRKNGVSLNRDLEASTYHAYIGVDPDSDLIYIEDNT